MFIYKRKIHSKKLKFSIYAYLQTNNTYLKIHLKSNVLIYIMLQGHKLVVFDVNESAVSKLTEVGANRASDPTEVVKNVEVVVSMLPSNQDVLDVYNIKNGLLR